MSEINNQDIASFSVTPSGISFVGRTKEYDTFEEMLLDKSPGLYASVKDATGDPTVNKGGALYRRLGDGWKKIFEEECMDLDIEGLEIRVKWDDIKNKPDVQWDLLPATVASAHSHENISILGNLSENENHELLFNGTKVSSSTISWNNVTDKPSVNWSMLPETISVKHSHSNKNVIDRLTEDADHELLWDGKIISKITIHTHENKNVIDLFSVDSQGALYFNGQPIATDTTYIDAIKTYLQTQITTNRDKINELVTLTNTHTQDIATLQAELGLVQQTVTDIEALI